MDHFGHMHYRATLDTNEFRRFYVEPRCVVSHNGSNNYPYFGSFCALERCVNPYCNCKDCSHCVIY